MSVRQVSLKLHRWVGLLAAIFLFIEGVTGGIMAWGPQLGRMLDPPVPRAAPPVFHVPMGPASLPLTALVAGLERSHSGFRVLTLQFPARPDLAWSAELQSRNSGALTVWFDPHTGGAVGERASTASAGRLAKLIQVARRFHGNFLAGVGLLLLACSGLILWWPRSVFTLRLPASAERVNFDLHAAIGFYASLFLVIFSGTAVVMSTARPSIAFLNFIMRTPAVPPPGAKPTGAPYNHGRWARLAVRLDLDQALRAATQALPGAHLTEMRMFNDRDGVIEFAYRPADAPAALMGHLLVDPTTGRIQPLADPNKFTLAERIVRAWVPRIHQGEIFGRVSLWIAGFVSFMLALLAITGPAIWWFRRRGRV